jgi:hypothetical protein
VIDLYPWEAEEVKTQIKSAVESITRQTLTALVENFKIFLSADIIGSAGITYY